MRFTLQNTAYTSDLILLYTPYFGLKTEEMGHSAPSGTKHFYWLHFAFFMEIKVNTLITTSIGGIAVVRRIARLTDIDLNGYFY